MDQFEAVQRFELAVEDRFIIAKLTESGGTLPEGDTLVVLAETLKSLASEYTILCDFTKFYEHSSPERAGESNVTSRAADVVRLLVESGGSILCTPRNLRLAQRWFGKAAPLLPVKRADLPVRFTPVDLTYFREDANFESDQLDLSEPPSEEEYRFLADIFYPPNAFASYDDFVEDINEQRKYTRKPFLGSPTEQFLSGRRWLGNFIHRKGRNSLLTEFAIHGTREHAVITPYHTHALHSIETRESLLVAQPAILARQTQNLLTEEIRMLETLVNTDGIREGEIQRYLERHPNVLRALGYRDIYPQVVLQRDDATSLRPDFLLRPLGNDWCDILDIKLPTREPLVGTRDRKAFSHRLHQLGAQLREYAAYFENERWSRRIEDVYGIKCYRPRLIGVIGRDLSASDDRQLRRVMTTYTDTKIVTFDELVRIARSRILI